MTQPLEEIQDRIVERLHAGEIVDHEAILAANPEHAEALKGFFRVLELVEKDEPPAVAPSRLGEFQILRELGRGGMGVVYEAEQLSLKRRVALKVLPPALGHDARLRARFQREAEAAGKLRHPGIVPVISFGDVAGTPFFAMELVEGRSLARVLAELREGRDAGVPAAGEPRRRWALGIAIAVAEALDYAHAQGIVHRDIKPGNILLDREDKPRLSDFGLAQDLGMEGLTISGESFGSPRYMSPEQAFRRKLPVDQRTDIYSLGVTLYEMLTLRYPYDGATSVEYMTELSQGHVIPPSKVDASIPRALESVLLRALAAEPEQRYAGARAFAEDLKAVLDGRAPARETSAWARMRTRLWRRPLFWTTAAASVFGLIAFCWYEVKHMPFTAGPIYVGGDSVTAGARLDQLNGMVDQARVELRRFVSRNDPGTYACTVLLPKGVGEGSFWDPEVHWSVSLDGKNWKLLSTDAHPGDGAVPAVRDVMPGLLRWRVALKDVIGGALGSDSVTLYHRLDSIELHPPHGPQGSVTLTRFPAVRRQTVFIYDDLPADYPEAVSDANLDREMRSLLTPAIAQFRGTSSLEGGTKAIQIELGLNTRDLPAPVACELKLFQVGEELPFARGRLVYPEQRQDSLGHPTLVFRARPGVRLGNVVWFSDLLLGPQPIDVVLEPMAGEKEVQLLLDLQQGRIDQLRVVFEPSRTVARESSYFDRYWNGKVDVTVPLKLAPGIH